MTVNFRRLQEMVVEHIASAHSVYVRQNATAQSGNRVTLASNRKLQHTRTTTVADVIDGRPKANALEQRQNRVVLVRTASWIDEEIHSATAFAPSERQPVVREPNGHRHAHEFGIIEKLGHFARDGNEIFG